MDAASDDKPALQLVQSGSLDRAKVPAVQFVHAPPETEDCPSAQAIQMEAESFEE